MNKNYLINQIKNENYNTNFKKINVDEISENYEINEDGIVRNISKNKLLIGTLENHGYFSVKLRTKSGKDKKFLIHRLVIFTFGAKSCKNMVNHIDGNKLNNNIKNLEWVTQRENIVKYFKSNNNKRRENMLNLKDIKEIKKIYNNQKKKNISQIWKKYDDLYTYSQILNLINKITFKEI